jgi:hypothetical protein
MSRLRAPDDGAETCGVLADISDGGARFRCLSPDGLAASVIAGCTVELYAYDRGWVAAEVAWRDGGAVGLRVLDDGVHLATRLSPEASRTPPGRAWATRRRRAARYHVLWSGEICLPETGWHAHGFLSDIAAYGVCFRTFSVGDLTHALQRGREVVVRVRDGGWLTAQVAWCDDDKLGLAFDTTALDVDTLLQRTG